MSKINGLSDAEEERLAILAEECGEVLQAIGKILRHGYMSRNPLNPNHTNRFNLEKECGDVRYAMIMLCDSGDLNKEHIHARANYKRKNKRLQYLHYQDY